MITSRKNHRVLTNNPLVAEKLADTDIEVVCLKLSFEEVLKAVRDEVHKGSRLLTHPLSGSVKPGQTPYKSVLIYVRRGPADIRSLGMIENALETCRKFPLPKGEAVLETDGDFRLIDWTLLMSGLKSLEQSF